MRRDVEPDWGLTLLLLAGASVSCACFSLLTMVPLGLHFTVADVFTLLVSNVAALIMGAAGLALSGHDLLAMRAGLMDLTGRRQTLRARWLAGAGVAVGLLPWLTCGTALRFGW
jgi:hypothetical protein